MVDKEIYSDSSAQLQQHIESPHIHFKWDSCKWPNRRWFTLSLPVTNGLGQYSWFKDTWGDADYCCMFLSCCWAAPHLSCPLGCQTAIFQTSLLQQNTMQALAVEREKLPFFSSLCQSFCPSAKGLSEDTVLLHVLFQAEHLTGQMESAFTLLPGHCGSRPEEQLSFESCGGFSPVHGPSPSWYLRIPATQITWTH